MRKLRVITTDAFDKEIKKLHKKYRRISEDVDNAVYVIANDINAGEELKTGLERNPRKLRITIKDKGKGKSGGGRIIYYVDLCVYEYGHRLYLMHIYDKSEFEDVDLNVIKKEAIDILDIP